MLIGYQEEPMRIIVMGTAGTGKSYLIKAIIRRLREMLGDGSEIIVLVLALKMLDETIFELTKGFVK